MYNAQNVYQSGARFSLAGLRTMYGARGLGDVSDTGIVIDCNDPANAGTVDCPGGGNPGGIDWTTLLSQGITDVTQLLRPGTPSPVRVYTPGTTAAGSLFSSPITLLALIGAAVYLARK